MSSVRQQNFLLRKEKILATAETLLLDNNQDITLSELASELDIAKGTIYKHFKSKNQLYLELVILNEQRLLEISKKYNHDIKIYVSQYMLYNMLNSNKDISFATQNISYIINFPVFIYGNYLVIIIFVEKKFSFITNAYVVTIFFDKCIVFFSMISIFLSSLARSLLV